MKIISDSIDVILDRCITDIQTGRKGIEECLRAYPDFREELTPLLNMVVNLEDYPRVDAPDDFRGIAVTRLTNILQARSVNTKREVGSNNKRTRNKDDLKRASLFPLFQSNKRGFSIITALIIIVLFLGLMMSGVITVSASALPGEVLYPIKSQIEKIRLDLSLSDFTDSQLYLTFASRRISESSELLELGRPEYIDEVMNDYSSNLIEVLTILFESKTLTNQERASLAAYIIEELIFNQEQINIIYTRAPQQYQGIIKEALLLSQYGHDIVVEAILSSSVDTSITTSAFPGEITVTPTLENLLLPTDLPEINLTAFPSEGALRDPNIRRTAIPGLIKIIYPDWVIDPSLFPNGFVWPPAWPTFSTQYPVWPTGTVIPPTRSLPSDYPSDMPTPLPKNPTERFPERTPRPSRP